MQASASADSIQVPLHWLGMLMTAQTDTADLLSIDLAIHNNPGASPQLGARCQIDDHGLAVGTQALHDERPA